MSKNILIVEDDKDIREPLRDLLEVEGYPVMCISSGNEALNRLRSGPPPGLILCDLTMPGMSGAEFIQTLKTMNEDFLPCTVILSAAADGAQKAADLGVAFVRKPIDIEVLMDLVRRNCGE